MFSRTLFGLRLRNLRKQHGETQSDLGKLLLVKKSQIRELEQGNVSTTPEKIVTICTHYHVSADYLLGFTDDPEPHWNENMD